MLRPARQADVILAAATGPLDAAEPPAAVLPPMRPLAPPGLLNAPTGSRPIASVTKSPTNFVVAAQATDGANPITEPVPAAQAPATTIPLPQTQSPAPNSPQAKQQVRDGMDELRRLLETTAQASGPETVAKPAPADASTPSAGKSDAASNKPSKTRAKITKVGEGDEHFALDIQDADIRDVLEMISRQGQINILPSNSVKGKVTASLHDVDMDSALAAILKSTGYVTRRHGKFVYVGTSADFQSLEQSLDKIGTRIYRTNYVRASDMQALITPLLTQGVGAISVTSPSEQGIATDSSKAGGNSFAGGEAVLVRDYEAVLAQIDQVVGEIDKRPLQVAIEAMILSVKLDDSDQFGVNFALLRQNPHILLASGSPPGSLGDVNLGAGGLNFGFLDSTLGVFLSAVESVGDTHVIATPRVVCLDKQRAEILIGSQLGYISSTVTETSTAQNVNFLEVGTQLRIRPFISSDGLVRMEVHPELSTGTVTTQGGFTLPDKDLTQVTTNVMVRDGATVVIGGLIREDLTTTTTQIPLLGNLPGVGFLFRQKQEIQPAQRNSRADHAAHRLRLRSGRRGSPRGGGIPSPRGGLRRSDEPHRKAPSRTKILSAGARGFRGRRSAESPAIYRSFDSFRPAQSRGDRFAHRYRHRQSLRRPHGSEIPDGRCRSEPRGGRRSGRSGRTKSSAVDAKRIGSSFAGQRIAAASAGARASARSGPAGQ